MGRALILDVFANLVLKPSDLKPLAYQNSTVTFHRSGIYVGFLGILMGEAKTELLRR
jgi:hypothetical protein